MDKVCINDIEFHTKVAVTEDEHITGLMNVPWPPPVMIFPYNENQIRKFWMKNTISPLDILFCKSNRIVAIEKGEPLSNALIGPNEPTDLVIEMPFGTVEKNSIKVGDKIKVKYSVDTVIRKFQYNKNMR